MSQVGRGYGSVQTTSGSQGTLIFDHNVPAGLGVWVAYQIHIMAKGDQEGYWIIRDEGVATTEGWGSFGSTVETVYESDTALNVSANGPGNCRVNGIAANNIDWYAWIDVQSEA